MRLNELQWLAAGAPKAMLDHVRGGASPRKLRLFACACCRLVWGLLDDERARNAIEVAERFADGLALVDEVSASSRAALQCANERGRAELHAAEWTTYLDEAVYAADWCSSLTRCVKGRNLNRTQADLLRDLFGNPFRPAPKLSRAVLDWNSGQVVQLARSIYDERRFADLPVLADALEEAGCADEPILSHCRGPAPHALGCWALDLVLGKS